MILVSSKETQRIFLTTKTKALSLNAGKIDIIVSPEFYWVRKFEIPVKNETQARHVLPTLFEDIVDDTLSLTYQVIKLQENVFLCFAFNNKKIFEAIKNTNISVSNINSIYFAQNECTNFNSFEVDDQKYMYTSEGILIKVPNNLLENTMALEKVINSIKLSSCKVQIKLYNDVINTKFYKALFIIFGILIVINFIKYFSYNSEITVLEEKIINAKKINKLPSSMIQTNAILKKYDLTIKKENKKRKAISYILANKDFDLQTLDIENDEIILEYLSVNKNKVESYLKKRFKNLSFTNNSFALKVSIKL